MFGGKLVRVFFLGESINKTWSIITILKFDGFDGLNVYTKSLKTANHIGKSLILI